MAQIPDYKPEYGLKGLRGFTIRDHGYMATSFDPTWDTNKWSTSASDSIFEFSVPKGTKALAPGLQSIEFARESEIILQKELPFKVTKVTKTKNGENLVKAQILLGVGMVGLSAGLTFQDYIPGSTPRPQGDE